MPRWDKCLSVDSDYKEVWCVPSATQVPCSHQSLNKVLGSTVSAILFHKMPWCKNWIYKNKNKILSSHTISYVTHNKNTPDHLTRQQRQHSTVITKDDANSGTSTDFKMTCF